MDFNIIEIIMMCAFLCETIKKETNIQTGTRPQDTQKNKSKTSTIGHLKFPKKKNIEKSWPFFTHLHRTQSKSTEKMRSPGQFVIYTTYTCWFLIYANTLALCVVTWLYCSIDRNIFGFYLYQKRKQEFVGSGERNEKVKWEQPKTEVI